MALSIEVNWPEAKAKARQKQRKVPEALCRGTSRNTRKKGWNRKEPLLQRILKHEKKAIKFLNEKNDKDLV